MVSVFGFFWCSAAVGGDGVEVEVEVYRFKTSIQPDMAAASLIISHAGISLHLSFNINSKLIHFLISFVAHSSFPFFLFFFLSLLFLPFPSFSFLFPFSMKVLAASWSPCD